MTAKAVTVEQTTTVVVYDPDTLDDLADDDAIRAAREYLATWYDVNTHSAHVETEHVNANRVIVTFEH